MRAARPWATSARSTTWCKFHATSTSRCAPRAAVCASSASTVRSTSAPPVAGCASKARPVICACVRAAAASPPRSWSPSHADASSSGGGVRLEFVDEPTDGERVVERRQRHRRRSPHGCRLPRRCLVERRRCRDRRDPQRPNSERTITVHSSGGGVTVRYPNPVPSNPTPRNPSRTEHPMQQASLALAARASDQFAPTAVRAEQAVKVYGSGDTAVRALDGVDVAMPAGRWTAIMGPSGSGKSTLMHCLAGLDTLTSGRIIVGGVDLHQLSDKQLTKLRREKIGFVFQSFNLVPTLTALENITLPSSLGGKKPDREWLDTVVRTVGLGDRLQPPAVRAVGRSAAARRRRARARQPARGAVRGRADRQPRLAFERRGARPPARRGRQHGPDRRDGHARSRPRPRTPTTSCSSPTAASSTRWNNRPPSASSPA